MTEHLHGSGILSGPVDGSKRIEILYPEAEARAGLSVLHRASGFRGTVVRLESGGVVLRSPSSGLERVFRMTAGGFAVEGETTTLVPPETATPLGPIVTTSGSVAPARSGAKVARASRILVEGLHDAELVEKVWGDDLRHEAIVVERLDGVDDLAEVVRAFAPTADQRLGILVDHLVFGSKESRLAAAIDSPFVRVTGTPYVDIWQGIRPHVLGISQWPEIPRGQSWKDAMCVHFGVAEPGRLWKQLLGKVNTYADLEPDLVGAVEGLIDFVTVGE